MYDKGLITNNTAVYESDFYNKNDFLVIDKMNDIDLYKISVNHTINHNYNGENPPMKFLEKIKNNLFKDS